jgi:hypothetical protein
MPRSKVGNWVDRFEPLEPIVSRALSHAFGIAAGDSRLLEPALTIRGLVEADATEVDVARYVRGLFVSFGLPEPAAGAPRLLGIALWHIAKAGLVRDRAERRAQELLQQVPLEPRWSESVQAAILRAPAQTSTREPAQKPQRSEAAQMRTRDAT